MTKVLTFSRIFPAYHPKSGRPTNFVEKIYNSIYRSKTGDWSDALGTESNYVVELNHLIKEEKHHTIRAGKRWKVGDKFSPRVWSGKPYRSPMITIAPDIEIKKVWEFEILSGSFYINGRKYDGEIEYHHELLDLISKNDGLTKNDLLTWFQYPKYFKGQIICWNDKIEYNL